MRVAIYHRIARSERARLEFGLQSCREYCLKREWTIVDEYADARSRLAVTRLVREQERFDAVVCRGGPYAYILRDLRALMPSVLVIDIEANPEASAAFAEMCETAIADIVRERSQVQVYRSSGSPYAADAKRAVRAVIWSGLARPRIVRPIIPRELGFKWYNVGRVWRGMWSLMMPGSSAEEPLVAVSNGGSDISTSRMILVEESVAKLARAVAGFTSARVDPPPKPMRCAGDLVEVASKVAARYPEVFVTRAHLDFMGVASSAAARIQPLLTTGLFASRSRIVVTVQNGRDRGVGSVRPSATDVRRAHGVIYEDDSAVLQTGSLARLLIIGEAIGGVGGAWHLVRAGKYFNEVTRSPMLWFDLAVEYGLHRRWKERSIGPQR